MDGERSASTMAAPSFVSISSTPREYLIEAEELGRIVDQHAPARSLVHGDVRDQIDELAVIGHAADVGMRPVGSPQDALGRLLGEDARERDGVAKRRLLLRH